MNGECLDTNIVIALLEKEAAATARMRQLLTGYVSVVVLGELLYGIELASRHISNRVRLEQLLTGFSVLPTDLHTSTFYASIRAQLKRAGRPIPDNDIWIAATAMQHDLTLITRDGHFNHVEGLKVESWS